MWYWCRCEPHYERGLAELSISRLGHASRRDINTCNEIHATEDNPGLECRLVPNGVGRDGNKVPMPNNSVDFVVISETHIADIEIGDLEKSIFAEIRRILKPGGLFLWGNAIPTRVWEEAMDYLPTAGFELVNNYNRTKGAVVARDEDHDVRARTSITSSDSIR